MRCTNQVLTAPAEKLAAPPLQAKANVSAGIEIALRFSVKTDNKGGPQTARFAYPERKAGFTFLHLN
jgi:hypothetical protein